MNRQNLNRLIAWAVLALALAAPPLQALEGDRKQPIQIEADRVEIDERNGVSHYIGHVHLQQGTLQMEAERLSLFRKDGQLSRLITEGSPVVLEQQSSSTEKVRAEANRMEYNTTTAIVDLSGNAQVWQKGDHFSGDHIRYDIDKSLIKAKADEEGSGRVRVILQPATQESEQQAAPENEHKESQ